MLKRSTGSSTPPQPARVLWRHRPGAVVLITAALSSLAIIMPATTALAQEGAPSPVAPGAAVPGAAASAAPLAGPIRKSDVLSVTVAGEPNLSGPQRVDDNGMITLALAGQIKVADLATADAAETIAQVFKTKNLLRNPQVTVLITGRPSPTVFISGAINRQGRVEIDDETRLNEILEPAGLQPTSDLKRVTIMRNNEKIAVDYGVYRSGNDSPESSNNPLLKDGDKVYVYAVPQVAVTGTFKVSGEVRTALAATNLAEGTTILQAVQQAGGLTELADVDRVVIRRNGSVIAVPFPLILKGQKDKDVLLQDKDEVFIPRLEKPRVFHVNGGVPRANSFPLQGRVTLSDALALAGGPMDRVDTKKITVQRKNAQGQVEGRVYDLTRAADASLEIQAEDIVSVPFPPERRERMNVMGIIGAVSGIASLFTLFGGR